MRWKSDARRYGAVAMAMHWATAVAVFALLGSGLAMANAAQPQDNAGILTFHAGAGFFVGILTVLRLLWWFLADGRPARPAGTPRWQARAASAVHGLFYAVILLMVASGIGMMALSGAGEVLFTGQGALPDFDAFGPRVPHGFGAWLMMALIVAHVGAALYHQFLLRDRLLARMGIGRA